VTEASAFEVTLIPLRGVSIADFSKLEGGHLFVMGIRGDQTLCLRAVEDRDPNGIPVILFSETGVPTIARFERGAPCIDLGKRATIQVPHMAAALGVDTRLIYSLTFACGAGLAGLAGGLYAPTMTLVPTMGATFIMEAFVTVVIGGADVFLGTAPAGGVLAVVKSTMTSWQGQLFGQIGLLVAVVIVVRVLPKGISGFVLRERT